MVTLQSLGSFSLSIDKSDPTNRCHGNEPYLGYRGQGTGYTYGRLTYCALIATVTNRDKTAKQNDWEVRVPEFLGSPFAVFEK
jgi:hypothetical protein